VVEASRIIVGTVPSMPVTQTSSTQKNFDFVACSAILTGNINILCFSIKFHNLHFIHKPIPVLSGLLFEHAFGFFAKTPKPILCISPDGVALNSREKRIQMHVQTICILQYIAVQTIQGTVSVL
jgi:hypothetical protein